MTYIIFALLGAAIAYALTRSKIMASVNALLLAVVSFIDMPVLAWGFGDAFVLVIASLAMPTAVAAGQWILLWIFKRFNLRIPGIPQHPEAGKPALIGLVVMAAVGTLYGVCWGSTSQLVRAAAYHDLLGPVKTVPFQTAVEVLDQRQIRIVDEVLARRRAEELLGTDVSLGSQVEIGEMNIQNVAGRLRWVAPLEPASVWRWLVNQNTPGYVYVDANDMRDAKLVTHLDGKPISIKVMMKGLLYGNVKRRIYSANHFTDGLTDFTFEIDDHGRPYWNVTKYRKSIGFGGSEAVGIVLLDAQTGEMHDYGIADAPAWVDRIQPAEFVKDQVEDWGQFVNGYMNVTGADVLKPASGIELVYTKDGRSKWYMGLTTPKNPNGTTGFILVDARTKEVSRFEISGASEDAARASINGKVANYNGWHASWPVLYNIAGYPTYLSPIKDAAGNFKGVGLCSVDSRAITVVADDLPQALRLYQNALASQGIAVAPHGGVAKLEKIAGHVQRIAGEVMEGTMVYYVTLDTMPRRVIVANAKLGPQLALTQPGDAVTVTLNSTEEAIATAMEVLNAQVPMSAVPAAAEPVAQGGASTPQ